MKFGQIFALALGITSALAEPYPDTQSAAQSSYTSPYQFSPSVSDPSLIADFSEDPRALTNWQNWSLTPYADWNNFAAIQQLDSTWGPYYRPFKAPENTQNQSLTWMQNRLGASAALLRNTVPYGHHHINVWNVPDAAPWITATPAYEPGYGIDCSDYTHFMYNYGLGIQLKTGVIEQSEQTSAEMHLSDGSVIEIEGEHLFNVRTERLSFEDLAASLQAGDLLYIRSDPGLDKPISHVIMWLGGLATDENQIDQYLITDSHGDVVIDSNGNTIPSGPEIRPFTEDSYYYGSFDHVVRYLPLNAVPEPSTYAFLGLAFFGLILRSIYVRSRAISRV